MSAYAKENNLAMRQAKINKAAQRAANVHQLILDGKVIWDSVSSHYETNARTRISPFGTS